jgi:hypothetical protein
VSLVGELELPNRKLKELGIEHQRRFSPGIEKICLIMTANKSFPQSEKDIKILSGLCISRNSLHRVVQRYEEPEENICKEEVKEIAVDGGSVCLKSGNWKQFKTARVNERYHIACFKDDELLVKKLEKLKKKETVYLLGDGHDGVWNVFKELSCNKCEILDWYHLMENLYKYGVLLHPQKFSKKRITNYKKLLWSGKKEKVIKKLQVDNNFRKYLEKHRGRLINYELHKIEKLSSIGSGAVESSVKQIAARTNISGARWNEQGIRKILSVRTAYLNDVFSC